MKAEFDEFAQDYASAVNTSIDFSGMKVEHFVKGKAAHIDRFLQTEGVARDDRILDVGCGVGQYEQMLGGRYALTGIDMSPSSIEEAKDKVPASKFLSYDGTALPFESNSFRCAFTICVVHHVPLEARTNFISEVRRVLKPGGAFLIYEHNPWNPMTRWAVERCVFDKDAILLSRNYAVAWLRNNGFGDIRSEFLFSLPPMNDLMLRLDHATRRLPTGAQYVAWGRKA